MVESSRSGTIEEGDLAGVARALSQRFIDGSINQWRRRLHGVVQENGVDICTLALLFVADVIRDELFAGVQHMIFSPSCLFATVVLIICGAI